MREENVTIAIIGGNEQKTTIKRLFEEYNGDDCIIIELEISECCKVVKNLETPEKFMNISKKKHGNPKKSVLGKHYTQPYISTRYYWRGNIK